MRYILMSLLVWLSANVSGQDGNYEIDIAKIGDNLYLYLSYSDYQGQKISANGLLVDAGDSVLMIDTPWGNDQTIQLLDWIDENLQKPLALVVITHAHEDRIGGIGVIHERNIRTIGSKLTAVYALRWGYQPPKETFEKEQIIKIGHHKIELFYPGPGHTVDNSVVYIPDYNLLHGGCFVKSAEAKSLGNIADADLGSWPASLQAVQNRYPDIKTVIPGHGSTNSGAIENTLKLLNKK
ncbi:beta-lactamase II [Fulvivirga imtechensis AK7]|uniref:beta-lactamase n=1 Tax=Fulvivirga imtechensis AK7 TaxID=1237149 RepID=L8JST6_9BACT|nr:subclass B1 metallo-beta-lactamase [Fulvivirga imtechensis]ELR71238.1 beta-lactamase II [Fulvivirga imtechensis AK7]